jgi:hypothetical protein
MKALTIWPEWAYAITHLGKDGENRTWRLFDSLIGVPVAIHGGVRPTLGVREPSKRRDELLAFLETCKHANGEYPDDDAPIWMEKVDEIRGHIVAVVTFGEPIRHSSSPWAANDGQWFWPITSLRALPEPVKCKGAQGLWPVPAEIERLIVGPL